MNEPVNETTATLADAAVRFVEVLSMMEAEFWVFVLAIVLLLLPSR